MWSYIQDTAVPFYLDKYVIICFCGGFSDSVSCFSAVRVNWEICLVTTGRYVSDPLLTEKLTHT